MADMKGSASTTKPAVKQVSGSGNSPLGMKNVTIPMGGNMSAPAGKTLPAANKGNYTTGGK